MGNECAHHSIDAIAHIATEDEIQEAVRSIEAWQRNQATMQKNGGSSPSSCAPLLDRVGGLDVVKKVVELFYAKLYADPELIPFLHDQDVFHLRAKQSAFVSWLFGPPNTPYNGRSVRIAHLRIIRQRGFSPDHFEMGMTHFEAAMAELGAPESIMGEVMRRMRPFKEAFFTPSPKDADEEARWALEERVREQHQQELQQQLAAAHPGMADLAASSHGGFGGQCPFSGARLSRPASVAPPAAAADAASTEPHAATPLGAGAALASSRHGSPPGSLHGSPHGSPRVSPRGGEGSGSGRLCPAAAAAVASRPSGSASPTSPSPARVASPAPVVASRPSTSTAVPATGSVTASPAACVVVSRPSTCASGAASVSAAAPVAVVSSRPPSTAAVDAAPGAPASKVARPGSSASATLPPPPPPLSPTASATLGGGSRPSSVSSSAARAAAAPYNPALAPPHATSRSGEQSRLHTASSAASASSRAVAAVAGGESRLLLSGHHAGTHGGAAASSTRHTKVFSGGVGVAGPVAGLMMLRGASGPQPDHTVGGRGVLGPATLDPR